jgi:hypothetical protein
MCQQNLAIFTVVFCDVSWDYASLFEAADQSADGVPALQPLNP